MDGPRKLARRQFGLIATGGLLSLCSTGCRQILADMPNDGRLSARPGKTNRSTTTGDVSIDLDSRHAVLRLPASNNGKPLPLLVFLHGAGQSIEDMLEYLGTTPSDANVAVLLPKSRTETWDAVRSTFAADVTFLNSALAKVFETEAIDSSRVAVGGFSDGATYALSLGLINGDLFRKVIAFSPGGIINGTANGKPQFFISHGTDDRILPIDRCGRQVVAQLRKLNYEVTFKEFDGGHQVIPEIAAEAMKWVAK